MKFVEQAMHFRVTSLLITLILVCISLNANSNELFEEPKPMKASEILPADLVKNDYFSVREEVTWFDGLNQFTVDTQYGSIEIWGEPMLRVRLNEFIAWQNLNDTSLFKVGAKAVIEEELEPIENILMAFARPITTVKGIPQGVSRLFRRIIDDIDEMAETLIGREDEDPGELNRRENANFLVVAAETLTGVNSSYREWAGKMGVNPYTTNVALKEELNRVAKVDSVLRTGAKFVSIKFPKEVEIFSDVSELVYEHSWQEVVEKNIEMLEGMGLDMPLIERFLLHDHINLSLATLIVEALHSMEGVGDRSSVIKQAILLETEAEALWFGESVLMTQWFHKNEAPIARMLPDMLVPVVLTEDGRVVIFSAADQLFWTQSAATISLELAKLYEEQSDRREFWTADQVSERFVEGVEQLGWTVRSGMRSSVLPEIPWGLQDDIEVVTQP